MLKNCLSPKGAVKLTKSELKGLKGGASLACPVLCFVDAESGARACMPGKTCVLYQCDSRPAAYRCL